MEHSVSIEYARCRGCTTCMKTCPTQAIRVRRGKATILDERCIDCGACIRSCPHKAIKAVSDPLTCLEEFQYTVALPDPALYSQFQNMDNIDRILDALTGLGFDAVYETAKGASLLTDYARSHPEALRDVPRPIKPKQNHRKQKPVIQNPPEHKVLPCQLFPHPAPLCAKLKLQR